MRQEILDKLPRNWSEVTLNQYIAFIKGCKKACEGKTEKQKLTTIVALFFYQFTGQTKHTKLLHESVFGVPKNPSH